MAGQTKFPRAFPENVGLVAGVGRMAGQAVPGREWFMFAPVGGGVRQPLMTAEAEFPPLFFCFQEHFPVTAMGLVATTAFSSGKRVMQAESAHFLGGGGVA